MSRIQPTAVDFETKGIDERPHFPPEPVGVAIQEPGRKPRYYGWGHPTGNNCTRIGVARMLRDLWRKGTPLVFHNSKFDLEVALQHFELDLPPWHLCHDTLFLCYLDDPHNRNLQLKPLAERYLNEPPTERDELRDWVINNVPEAKRKKSEWARWLWLAPCELVGKYACGDVSRTAGLFKWLFQSVAYDRQMAEAYARELKLVPHLMRLERRGVRVDLPLLAYDVAQYRAQFHEADLWLRKKTKTPDLEVDKDDQLCDALERSGLVDPDDWLLTETGKRSTSKESIRTAVKNPAVAAVLEYRATLATCMRTFLEPWLETAQNSGGMIHFNWNQTKAAGEDAGGTRTGRLSSSPNAQNIPTDENIEKAERALFEKAKLRWMPLPRVRKFIVADNSNSVLCDRDFNQQELRVLANFEGGAMRDAYLENPRLDLHDYAMVLIAQHTGLKLTRKVVKTIAFGLLYGMGAAKLAQRLGVTIQEAQAAKDAYLNTFPGVKQLMDDLKYRGRTNDYMTTWGGRQYYAEPARMINGRMRDFSYKLINYLIQGSSADITKEAVLRYEDTKQDSRLLLTVHDEVMICAPKKVWKREMATLRTAMNDIELDVPLLSDGEVGYRWFEMEACE